MNKYYYEKANDLANEDSPLKFVIYVERLLDEKIRDKEEVMIAWCYDEEFAKKLVKVLSFYELLEKLHDS